jgi:mannose-6-phosphate isomerase-like protein (cupin superfamily)
METKDLDARRVEPAEERSVRMPGGRLVTTKVAAERTGWAYSLFEVEVGTGGGEVAHVQHREDEYVYVIYGSLDFMVEGIASEAGAGTHLFVPRAPCTPTRTPAMARAGCSWSTRRAGRRRVSWRRPASRRPARQIARTETTGGSPSSRRSTASRYARQKS